MLPLLIIMLFISTGSILGLWSFGAPLPTKTEGRVSRSGARRKPAKLAK